MLFQVLVPILSPWLPSQLLFGQSYCGRPALCKFRRYQCGQTAGTSLLFLNIVAKCVFPRVNPIATGTTLRASFQSQSWFPLPCIIKSLFISLGVFYLFKISLMGEKAVKLRWQIKSSNQRRWPSLFVVVVVLPPKRPKWQSLPTMEVHGNGGWLCLHLFLHFPPLG